MPQARGAPLSPPRLGAGRGPQGGQRQSEEEEVRAPRPQPRGEARGSPARRHVGKKEGPPRRSCSPKRTGPPEPRLPVQAGDGPQPCRAAAEQAGPGRAGPRPARPLSFELFTTPANCPWASPAMSLVFPVYKIRQKCGLCWHVTGMKPGEEVPGQATASPHPPCQAWWAQAEAVSLRAPPWRHLNPVT